MEYLNCRGSAELTHLLNQIFEFEPHATYSEIVQRAEHFFICDFDKIPFKTILKRETLPAGIDFPASFKVTINPEEDAEVDALLRKQYCISRIRSSWKLLIVLKAYLMRLQDDQKSAEEETDNFQRIQLAVIRAALNCARADQSILENALSILKEHGGK